MSKLKIPAMAAAVLGVGLGLWCVCGGKGGDEVGKDARLARIKVRNGRSARSVQRELSASRISRKKLDAKALAELKAKKELEKPVLELEQEEERRLTELQRQLLMDIRQALDRNDREAMLRIVQKMQASDEWPDGIPVAIRRAAIQSLSWFGSNCMPEIAGFLGDPEPEILSSALDAFQNALMDVTLSDRELSAFLTAAARTVNDANAMGVMMMGLNNMRHSVAIATMTDIMANGNGTAQGVLDENIALYTCEDGLDTPEKLAAWLEENPDNPYDEEFYGGIDDSAVMQ